MTDCLQGKNIEKIDAIIPGWKQWKNIKLSEYILYTWDEFCDKKVLLSQCVTSMS